MVPAFLSNFPLRMLLLIFNDLILICSLWILFCIFLNFDHWTSVGNLKKLTLFLESLASLSSSSFEEISSIINSSVSSSFCWFSLVSLAYSSGFSWVYYCIEVPVYLLWLSNEESEGLLTLKFKESSSAELSLCWLVFCLLDNVSWRLSSTLLSEVFDPLLIPLGVYLFENIVLILSKSLNHNKSYKSYNIILEQYLKYS